MALSKNIINFLNTHNTNTTTINSLIVSNFLLFNKIKNVKNQLISSLNIDSKSEIKSLLDEFISIGSIESFEDLIESFEFVISPSHKILNGAVYTPKFIREYIVEKSIKKTKVATGKLKIGDISCGCGGFLITAAKYLKINTKKTYSSIYSENIFGIDVESYSIERTEILLTLFAILEGEDKRDFKYNLVVGNSLDYSWREKNSQIEKSNGFDVIVGNPPYVCSRNMDSRTLKLLKDIEVSSSGHPDLYIPFFQIGIENLNPKGVLGYITVNTFLKSVNGRALRNYFSKNKVNLIIMNFGGEQLFKDRNTYTCLCFISFEKPLVSYVRTSSDNIEKIDLNTIETFRYENLDNIDGWNLVNDFETSNFIKKIEKIGAPFGKLYQTRNGIATLKNEVYKFKPIREDGKYYYIKKKKIEYPIEKAICRNIINANKVKEEGDIERLLEKIIFPYDANLKIINEKTLIKKFPKTYSYFLDMKIELATRDKGKGSYEEWFAYGRRQSMDINKFKLFFAHISKRPRFVLCEDRDLLFYNGISIISDDVSELLLIKKILESDIFFKYISHTTKDYSSGYISMSKNYIKKFGVVKLNELQKNQILLDEYVENYLRELYGLSV